MNIPVRALKGPVAQLGGASEWQCHDEPFKHVEKAGGRGFKINLI